MAQSAQSLSANRQAMDPLDQKLIALLRHNARRSVSDLAEELGISRATVRARIGRLEQSRQIIGYTVVLGSDTIDQRIRGVMMIEVEGHAADRVIRGLEGFPEISTIHTTNGRWDLIVELGTHSLGELDSVLRRIRLLPGITKSETNLLLATPRSSKAWL